MHWAISLMLLSTACQGSHIVEEVGVDDKSHLTEERNEKFMDILSKYEYDSNKVEATEIIERFSQCVRKFDNDESKGGGWTSTTSPTCVSVGESCTRDWRNLTDAASDLSKEGAEEKKGGGWTSHPPGWHSTPSVKPPVGWSSGTQNQTCCNQDMCTRGKCCTPTPAFPNHSPCTQDSHCCGFDQGKSTCDTSRGICKLKLGASCTASYQCINGNCDVTCCIPNGACQPSDSRCTADNQCCNGFCVNRKCLSKQGSSCCAPSDCMPPATCTDNTCCINLDSPCSASSVCCTGHCNGEIMQCTMCGGAGDSCTLNLKGGQGTCCSGRKCINGICKKKVYSGACTANDVCSPSSKTECVNGMCCTTPGHSCATTGKCCSGMCSTKGEKTTCDG